MAQVIDARDPTTATLEEVCDSLSVWGFDPNEEQSLSHAANLLKRLGNDPRFLGDVLVSLLAGRGAGQAQAPAQTGAVEPNRVMLAAPAKGNFAISAVLWPSAQEQQLRAGGERAFGYGLGLGPRFDFLSLGYFGPGREADEFEYDAGGLAGWPGETVELRPLGKIRLERGMLRHYRAGRDAFRVHPPEALSVSLTLSHNHAAQSWANHFAFDIDAGRIMRVMGAGPSEAFLRIAVALGGAEAQELALRFGRHHPSDRMRLAAWRALAGRAEDDEARDAVWQEAESSGSRAVAAAARYYREG